MEFPRFKILEVTGDISIERVTGRIPQASYRCLIMGPTGSGKSSFIEALAGESQKLSISKDQLAGYTQNVNAYQVVNVNRHGNPVYLVDTPGFSDTKISEMEIIDMIRKWVKDNDLDYVHRILYLTPISQTRLPRSRRRTIEMLKQLLAPVVDRETVTFVTTMWDMLHNEQTQKRAASNFDQLRFKLCRNFFGQYEVSITQFMNTKKSALEALDELSSFIDSFSRPISSASPNYYQDLHERIEGGLQAKQMIEFELAQPGVQTNVDLRAILEQNQQENRKTLSKFIAQMVNFGPIPKGFEEAHQCLQASIEAMQHTPSPPSLESPTLPASESAAIVAIAGSSNQSVTILQGDNAIPATASRLPEEAPLHITTTTPDNLHTEFGTDAVRLSTHREPAPQLSPSSLVRLDLSRMLILKGLLRRLIQAVKRRGRKLFKKNND